MWFESITCLLFYENIGSKLSFKHDLKSKQKVNEMLIIIRDVKHVHKVN
jgi:hypothetical protein